MEISRDEISQEKWDGPPMSRLNLRYRFFHKSPPRPEIVHEALVLSSPVYWKRVIGTVDGHLLHGRVEADGW